MADGPVDVRGREATPVNVAAGGRAATGAHGTGGPRRSRGPRSWPVHAALVPACLLLVVFFGLPIVRLLQTSFSSWYGIGDMTWLGTGNYTATLGDEAFWSSLGRSAVLGLGCAVGLTVIATVLAALISAGIRGASVYRVIFFLPAIAPPAAVGVFWALSFQPRTGVVNAVLGRVGLGNTHAWLADPGTALFAVMAVAIWTGVGFAFLVLLGAMEDVPVSVYEAGALDGAGAVRRFFSLTLPLIRPVLSMVVLLEVIWSFNAFTLVWALTTGGPGDATVILPVLVYKEAFQMGNFGPAAAASVLGGVLLLAAAAAGQWLGSRQTEDA